MRTLDENDLFNPATGLASVPKSSLHPWGIVFSFISCLDSDSVVSLVSGTGLQVDWSLSKAENYSHKTRVRAYLPRIQAEYESLPEDRQLAVTALMACGLAAGEQKRADDLRSRLSKIGWRLEQDRLVPSEPNLRELFFPKGSQHDAYVEIRALLDKARESIALIDPWIDSSLLTLLSSVANMDIQVDVLTSRVPKDFCLEAKKFLAQNTRVRLEVRATAEFHDRFLVLDDTICYHIGASIKDAGNKAFMISQIEDERNREALLAQHRQSWDSANVVFKGDT